MDVSIRPDSEFGIRWSRSTRAHFSTDPEELAQTVLEEFLSCLDGDRPGGFLTRALFEAVKRIPE